MENEKVYEFIKNLRVNYDASVNKKVFANPVFKSKYLGALEVLLMLCNVLTPFIMFDQLYKTVEREFTFMFWKIKYKSKETYEEFILRNVDEFIKSHESKKN